MGKILVVDDELVIGTLLKDVLTKKGHDVIYFSSAKEALILAQKEKENIDLYIVDLKMPEMDGIELLAKIKTLDPLAVVVIITGHPTFESVQSVLRLGGYDYINKPFNISDMSFIVNRGIAYHDMLLLNVKLKKDIEARNTVLEEKVKERTEELLLLTEMAKEISSHLSLDDVLETIVTKVSSALKSELCSLLLYDKDEDALLIKTSCGLDQRAIQNTRIKRGEDISGWVFEQGEAVLVKNIENDPRFQRTNQEKYYTASFMSIPLKINDDVIGVINISNKKDHTIFTEDDLRFLRGFALEAAIAIENANLYTTLEGSALNTIYALNTAVDVKDNYSKEHSEFVTQYGMTIAQEMNLPKDQIEIMYKSCLLHDIGKIAIHDHILTKAEQLTTAEWEEIKTHPIKGANILKPLKFLGEVITIVEQHHERYDGSGYPRGLKGEEISLGARIMAVADSYAAMTAKRPYRDALPREQAIAEIERNRGTQFDPQIIDVFLQAVAKKKI
jgi:putative nucleotidyltransferase with HDIG domain